MLAFSLSRLDFVSVSPKALSSQQFSARKLNNLMTNVRNDNGAVDLCRFFNLNST